MATQTRHSPRITALAISVFFFANGATYASWIPRLPEIRAELDLSDTALGLTLLGGGIGGLAMSLLSGRLVDRVGSRTATVTTSVLLSMLLPLIALSPVPAALFATLLVIGGIDGLTDVAMNSQALQLQRTVSRSIVNRMHATWSIGTLLGGIVASRAAAAGVGFATQLVVTAILLVVCTLVAATRLLPPETADHHHYDEDGRRLRPSRLLLAGLFGVGVLAVLAELPATEWASLVMVERFDLSVGAAGIGFIGFTAGMVVGRLGGDRWSDALGAERFRRASAALATAGLLLAALGPAVSVTVGGFFLAGVGGSVLFPMSVRRASELVPGATGVAMFSAGARLGILLGAPLMGAISDATTRSIALIVVGAGAAAASGLLRLPAPRERLTPPG